MFTFFVFLIVLSIFVLYLNLIEILLYGIISGILILLIVLIGVTMISYPFLYYYIVCYYFKVCFQEFSLKINSVNNRKLFVKQNNLIELLDFHNSICFKIYKYNQFWCEYYFIVCYTVIPISLLLIELAFFNNLIFVAQILFQFTALFYLLSLFSLNLITASINSEAKISEKLLYKILFRFNNLLNIGTKLKVMLILFQFSVIYKFYSFQ